MKRFNNEVMLGGFIVAAGGLLAYMAIAVGGFNFTPGVHVKADFANASGLVKDASIAIAGVEVGHVESLGVDGGKALVTMFIRKDAHVRADVVAKVRAKSLLGEKYLELVPQSTTAPELKDGDTISQTQASVEVDEVLAALGPVIKKVDPQDVATIVHTVAKTMNDKQGSLETIVENAAQISGQVNDMISANRQNVDKIASNVATLTTDGSAMLKAKRPEIERTVTNIDHLTGVLTAEAPALTRKANAIATKVDEMTTTLNNHAPQLMTNLDTAMKRLPNTLDDLDAIRGGVEKTLGKVNPLLDKANSFDAQKMHELAQEILIKNGVRVYMYPFGPSGNENDWKKIPEKGAATK